MTAAPTPTSADLPPAALPPPPSTPPSPPPSDATASHGDPPRSPPSAEFLALVGHDFARRHLVLSEGVAAGVERLVAAPHASPSALHNIGVRLGRPVGVRHAPPETVAAAIDRAYVRAAAEPDEPSVVVEGSGDVAADLEAAVREAEGDLLRTRGKAPAVRLVDLVLFEALQRGASDVHVQPVRDHTLVRYRLDGALHTVRQLPASLAAGVVGRIKVMARLDVAERRAPQDGRATVTIGGTAVSGGTGGTGGGGGSGSQAGRRVDLRVSVLPSTYGERVVLRLLDPSRSPHLRTFAALGMPPDVERRYLAQLRRTSGIVLSTGPTGSGKTTTLYTSLAWLSADHAGAQARGCELNMMTVEDPVEYDLSTGGRAGLSVSQTQVDPRKGVTFATGLRHILRQDPDVIMVGEIRDEETARIAVQASLTGHLVLSTLHTNDAASAVARLLDLGIEPFLVGSSLSAVLAQRLVRTTHPACTGRGCPECLGTGFRGRTGLFELLVLDGPLRELASRRATAIEIKAAAQRAGMATLRQAGQRLAELGLTTREEIGRVIDVIDPDDPIDTPEIGP